jgi:hypothetical protein
MPAVTPALAPEDDLLSRFTQGLVTRTLAHFAEEARLDGESLKDAVERYEVDYAWHVLGSERLREAVLTALAAAQGRAADAAQLGVVQAVLESAAAAQPCDALMSFDNDLPELLSGLLIAAQGSAAEAAPEAA